MKNPNHSDNLQTVETTKPSNDDSVNTGKTGVTADEIEQELAEILGGEDSIDSGDDIIDDEA